MKNIIVILIFNLITVSSFSQTQLEINQNEDIKFKTADNELNITYKKILKEYKSDTAFLKNLKISQGLWIKFRDAEMKTRYPDRENGYYGSSQSTCWSNYLTQLTNQRTKTLKIWLVGISEGDICAGSIKTK